MKVDELKEIEKNKEENRQRLCDAKHSSIDTFLRYIIMAIVACVGSISGLYLYAADQYVPKETYYALKQDLKEMKFELRQEIRNGLEKIEKKIDEKQAQKRP